MREMDALRGEWTVESSLMPGVTGRAVFEPFEDGFLVLRSTAPDPVPDSTWIVGADDESPERHTALYHDSRGVSRIYQMSLAGGVWRIWRDAPGFAQRFSGTLSADGRTISGAWEKSLDNATWEHDFDLTYRKTA